MPRRLNRIPERKRQRLAPLHGGSMTMKSVIAAFLLALIVALTALNSSFIQNWENFASDPIMVHWPTTAMEKNRDLPDWYLTTECSIFSIDCVSREMKRAKYQPYPFPLVNLNVQNGTILRDKSVWQDGGKFPSFRRKDHAVVDTYELRHENADACVQRATTKSLKEQLDDLLPSYDDFKQKEDYPNERIAFTISDYSYSKDMIDDVFHMAKVVMKLEYFFLVAMDQATLELACNRGYPVIGWTEFTQNTTSRQIGTFATSYGSNKKVADVALSKWLIALEIMERQFPVFFFEMDVWFLRSPKSLWRDQEVDVIFSGHADNPDYINIGIYSVLPTERSKEYFQICIDLFMQHPKVHDQFIMMQIIIWEKATKEGREIEWTNNHAGSNDVWGNPPPELPKFRNGYVSHGRFPIWAIVSGERPVLSEQVVAIHVLTGAPLTTPHGKKQIAKEMGAWVGSNGYYDSDDSKYLWVDGHIYNAVSVTMTYPGRRALYHYHDFALLRWTIACTIALANHTGRIWVMPKVVNNRGMNFVWTILDMETVEPFVEVRETNFPSNPRGWKTRQRFNPVSRIGISGDEGASMQLYRQRNAWATKTLAESWNFTYVSAADWMEKWFALADEAVDARVLLAGLPAVIRLITPVTRLYSQLWKDRKSLDYIDFENATAAEKEVWHRKYQIRFFDAEGKSKLDPSSPLDNVLRVYDNLKWCKHHFGDDGLLEWVPSRATARHDCYGKGSSPKDLK